MTDPTPALKAEPRATYRGDFWCAYVANVALMVAVSILYRYSDFIVLLGGTEFILGAIVGVGAIGSLAMRLALGSGIDRQGPRIVWLLALFGVIVALLGHLLVVTPYGPLVFFLRTLYHTCIAASFGASITYVSLRAPADRMAEMIGMLGSSGFVGMALGGELGDLLYRESFISDQPVRQLFVAAAIASAISLLFAALATHRLAPPPSRRKVAAVSLVRRYHPGWMLAMAAAMGAGIGLPGTFLRPYTATRGISNIGMFFTSYALTAFVVRLATRRACAVWGTRATAVTGMAFLALSLLLYLPVQTARQLMIPGIAAGIAHALLFPAIVAGGSQRFPERYRGLGVALMLGMFDMGTLVGMPLAGGIIDLSEQVGLAPYPMMLGAIVTLLVAVTAAFAVRWSGRLRTRQTWSPESSVGPQPRIHPPARDTGQTVLTGSLGNGQARER